MIQNVLTYREAVLETTLNLYYSPVHYIESQVVLELDEVYLISVMLQAVSGVMAILPTVEAGVAFSQSLSIICLRVKVSEMG